MCIRDSDNPETIAQQLGRRGKAVDLTKLQLIAQQQRDLEPVSYTHLRAHETGAYLVCRLLLDGIALLAEFGDLVAFGISTRLDELTDFLADPVAFCLQVAAFLLQIALLLGDQLQFGEINSLASPPQLLGDRFGVVTHKALIEHGFRGVSAGSLWQARFRALGQPSLPRCLKTR